MVVSGISSRFTRANPLGTHFWLSVAFAAIGFLEARASLRFMALFVTLDTPLETLLTHVLRLMPLCLAVEAALLCRFRNGASTALWFLTLFWLSMGAIGVNHGLSTDEAVAALLISLVAALCLIANVKPGHSGTDTAARRIGSLAIASLLFVVVFLVETSALGYDRSQLILLNAAFIAIAASDWVTTVRRPANGVPA
jgi:hypothetical protein